MTQAFESSPTVTRIGSTVYRQAGTGEAIIGRYLDAHGRQRELLHRAGSGGSLLVLDRDSRTRGDDRLIAHLPPDEPLENARLVCSQYLHEPPRRRCRALTLADMELIPFADEEQELCAAAPPLHSELCDRAGRRYRLGLCVDEVLGTELRWWRLPPAGVSAALVSLSVRAVIGALERYEPVRTLTVAALVRHRGGPQGSLARLRAELERISHSPLVLNRGIRGAVQEAVRREGLSMSEIAMRCGRVKYDSRGNPSGETSWLSRRVGLTPEGGATVPTPWIHSDVLALIARCGLGRSPREVELG
jgi:hypothetical protein